MLSKDLCVLIPSLEPDEKLPAYVDSLLDAGFGLILVINDGSSAKYDTIFDRIQRKDRCQVLRHEVNRGKGQALRTGIEYLRDHTAFNGVITADADGQHTAPDTLKLAAEMSESGKELLLGSRDFSSKNKNIPSRSRFGNRVTSAVFAFTNGSWLPDTQTGLRAVTRACYDDLLSITGDRFEYEMNMLIYCAQHRIPFKVIPIETIYLEENKSSHFNPLKDSWRIYKLLLGSFFRFSAASILSFLLDYLILSLIMFVFFKQGDSDIFLGGMLFSKRALIAAPVARLLSSPVNYLLNLHYAFRIKRSKGSAVRYAVLALSILVVTTFLFGWLNHFIPASMGVVSVLLKIVIDTVLSLFNYRAQQGWVFKSSAAK